jgi:hypothetical protein
MDSNEDSNKRIYPFPRGRAPAGNEEDLSNPQGESTCRK